jgi:hypothetical protein
MSSSAGHHLSLTHPVKTNIHTVMTEITPVSFSVAPDKQKCPKAFSKPVFLFVTNLIAVAIDTLPHGLLSFRTGRR